MVYYKAMTQTPVTLEALAELMTDGFDTMNGRFDTLETRMDGLETRMDGVETHMGAMEAHQQETNRRLGALEASQARQEGRTEALEADIKEIYAQLRDIAKRLPKVTDAELRAVRRQLAALTKWAQEVSEKTGVPLPDLSS